MKKFYIIIILVVLLVLTMAVSAGATEAAESMTEAATEAAETPMGAVESMTEEAETETPIEADSELGAMLNAATPEQIESIKQYIMYGVSALPFPDQVRLFVERNLNGIAWLAAAAAFVLFFIGNRLSNKRRSAEAALITNNAVEIAEKAEEAVKRSEKIIAMNEANMKAVIEKNNEMTEKAMKDAVSCMEAVLSKSCEGVDHACRAIGELREKESGLVEAEKLMATVLSDLMQASNLPQWKKDEFAIHLKEGLEKIDKSKPEEVTGHDDTEA